MRLREHTHKLLIDRPRHITLTEMAMASGLPYSWLSEFSKGRLKSPCADKIQTLYEYLSNDRTRLNFN